LVGDSDMKNSKKFIELNDLHQEFLARYRAQDWESAETLSRKCEKLNTVHLDRVYELYRERIAHFRQNPPPSNWDGATEALTK